MVLLSKRTRCFSYGFVDPPLISEARLHWWLVLNGSSFYAGIWYHDLQIL